MFKKILLTSLFFSSCVSVYAMTPTVSLSSSGSDSSVLVSVKGDANSPVVLSYYSTTVSGLQTQTLGTTDASGGFWTTVNGAMYNVSTNASVYVTVNNQQSLLATWPYTSTTANGVFSLSQTGIVLTPGQSSTITATNASSMYLFNNTNPSVVNVSINGSQINVSANSNG